jgi:hypothetical protein
MAGPVRRCLTYKESSLGGCADVEEETRWIVAGLVAECTVLIGQNVRDRELIGGQPPMGQRAIP